MLEARREQGFILASDFHLVDCPGHSKVLLRRPLAQSRDMIFFLFFPVLSHAIFIHEKVIKISLITESLPTHSADFNPRVNKLALLFHQQYTL
jgi:hypothetical protein